MTKQLFNFMLAIGFAGYLVSCQRELYFDVLPSEGSLQSQSGDCLPKTVNGTYKADQPVADSNFITAWVNVTRAGAFTISSDTTNGYSFYTTGSFSDTGLQPVKLPATGTPFTDGIDTFNLRYDNTACIIKINVLPAQPAAIFTLEGAPDTCIPAAVAGSYITDVAATMLETVLVGVHVSSAGSYTIATNTVNGYTFFGKGNLDTGLQIISLRALGTPLNAGTNVFTITAAGSACSFSVEVNTPVQVNSTDYFPLGTNNYWTYDDPMNSDTIKRIVTDSVLINNNLFRVMNQTAMFAADTASYFQKRADDYFQYGSVDMLTSSLTYVPSVTGEINFLKQNLQTGDTWLSSEYTGTLFSGQPVYLQYSFVCLDRNAAITVNGNSFINVYWIQLRPQLRSSIDFPFASTGEIIDLYYAKGVGLVYMKFVANNFLKRELKIKHWSVF